MVRWFFGSLARNEQREDSDVDICVEMVPNLFNRAGVKIYLQELLGCDVDVVRMRENMNPLFKQQILKYGIRVYWETSDGLWVLEEYWDYKWVSEHHVMPPIDFEQLVSATVEDEEIKKYIFEASNESITLEKHKKIVHYLRKIQKNPKTVKQVNNSKLECEVLLLALDMNKKYETKKSIENEETE